MCFGRATPTPALRPPPETLRSSPDPDRTADERSPNRRSRGRHGGAVTIRTLHHFGLTVRDVAASATWYAEVLGFERVGEYVSPDGTRRKAFLRHPGLRVRLGLVEHGTEPQQAFDETRIGLDHLAFGVDSAAELQEWQARLAGHGVTHSPVAAANSIPGAAVLVFRDPDGIQLELFFDPTL